MLRPLCRPSSCAHASIITAHQRIVCNVDNNECGVGYLVQSLWLALAILPSLKSKSAIKCYKRCWIKVHIVVVLVVWFSEVC